MGLKPISAVADHRYRAAADAGVRALVVFASWRRLEPALGWLEVGFRMVYAVFWCLDGVSSVVYAVLRWLDVVLKVVYAVLMCLDVVFGWLD
jgi:hypothetical protein